MNFEDYFPPAAPPAFPCRVGFYLPAQRAGDVWPRVV